MTKLSENDILLYEYLGKKESAEKGLLDHLTVENLIYLSAKIFSEEVLFYDDGQRMELSFRTFGLYDRTSNQFMTRINGFQLFYGKTIEESLKLALVDLVKDIFESREKDKDKTVHKLKTWTPYFSDIAQNIKTFDLRKNDRDFKVGDILILEEYDQEREIYTGLELKKYITYILEGGQFGLKEGYCVLGIV